MAEKSGASDFVPPYTDEEVHRRFKFLSLECENYLSTVSRVHPTWRLQYDPLVMVNVAYSAMDDIWRYKSYHLRDPEKLSDAVKRSAFFTKWIVRLRPIYFDRIQSHEEDKGLTLDKYDSTLLENEKYAIFISLNTIATDIDAEEIILDPNFHADLFYDLHYREISEDALLALYNIIRNAARGESVVFQVLK